MKKKRFYNDRMIVAYDTRTDAPNDTNEQDVTIDDKHSRMARQSHEAIKLIKTEDMPDTVEFLQDKAGIKKK